MVGYLVFFAFKFVVVVDFTADLGLRALVPSCFFLAVTVDLVVLAFVAFLGLTGAIDDLGLALKTGRGLVKVDFLAALSFLGDFLVLVSAGFAS